MPTDAIRRENEAGADRRAALRIVAIYAAVAAAWIYFSDQALGLLVADKALLLRISVLKGFFFILVTGGLLYHLIFLRMARLRRAEEELRSSQNLVSSLIEGTTDAIYVKDREGRYLLFNSAAAGFTGRPSAEVLGRDDTLLFPPEEARALMAADRAVMDGGKVRTYEEYLTVADGSCRTFLATKGPIFDAKGAVAGLFGIARDITERKQAEQEKATLEHQLRQAQKMEAVGHLAGGVAHDFNNILTAIMGYGNILELKLAPSDPLREYVGFITEASEKGATLTHSLLAFSRKQHMNPVPADLNAIVLGTEKILARVIREDIARVVRVADHDLVVTCDRGQIEQVLMNLATNASDAMPRGGTLTITTAEASIDDRFIQTHRYGSVGRYALLTVADSGVGMDGTTQERIFEPFFTTKETGKGTGLGLAMVYGTIKQHGGFITVTSSPGAGTTFEIYLPLAGPGTVPTAEGEPSAPIGGTEALLLVEDNATVRAATAALLRSLGYAVIEASDGEDAVAKFREHRNVVALVVSDVIMPGLSGPGLHDALRQIQPGVKVLFVSGYTADALGRGGLESPDVGFLAKPLRPEALSRAIRGLLDGRPSG